MKILASLAVVGLIAQVCPPCSPCNEEPQPSGSSQSSASGSTQADVFDAPPANSVVMATRWRDASHPVNIDLDWRLPTGAYGSVARAGTSESGIESIVEADGAVPDGIHVAKFELQGSSGFVTVDYRLIFPGFGFERLSQTWAPTMRQQIVLERRSGQSFVLYNSWVSAGESGAGSPTGLDPVEFQACWRNSTSPVNIDLSMVAANGRPIDPVFESGTANIGFERISIPAGVSVDDGIYRIKMELRGTGQFSDVTLQMRFLGINFERTERLFASTTRRMDVSVVSGIPSVVSSDW